MHKNWGSNLKKIQEIPEEAKKYTIMIVDDIQGQLDALTSLFSEEYVVIPAISGEKALETIDRMEQPEKLKLIISDLRMTGLSGVQFFDKLTGTLPNTIRIIHTATGSKSVYREGNYQVIQKGLEPEVLKSKVKQAIKYLEQHNKSGLDVIPSNS